MNIGQLARKLIQENPGMKNADVVRKIRELKPEAKTTEACIAWYKSDMKKKGVSTVTVQRTQFTVEEEILQVKLKLASLEEELQGMREADEANLLSEEEELMEKLKRIQELKAAKEEPKEEVKE